MHIALIEDHELVLKSLARIVKTHGFQTSEFESAEAYLDANDFQVDCVIVDYRLPGISGFELIRMQIESLDENCPPFIFISGNVDSETTKTLSDFKNVAVLRKPCPPKKILETIEKITGRIS